MSAFIITFGQAHRHEHVPNGAGGTVTVDKDSVVCINAKTEIHAYDKANELFGDKWSGITNIKDCNSKELLEFFPRGIVATFKT